MSLIVKCPINSLSFGNVSMNILKELHKKNIETYVFPHGNIDITAFDKVNEDFKKWLEDAINKRYSKLNKDTPSLQLWHINGSENRISPKQNLLTFYETDEPTDQEKSLVNFQDHTFFSSNHSLSVFSKDCPNTSFCPIGFDEDFHLTGKQYLPEEIIHFGLIGKFEKRKNHALILKAWTKKYGNNPKFRLTCLIDNPFLQKGELSQKLNILFNGENFSNVSFLPRLRTNSEVNDLLNAIDIDLSGLSGAEGWNLPSFNSTCLGKWSIVLNNTSHKDWATNDNCILIEPTIKEPIYDGVFFKEGSPYNQGNMSVPSEEEMMNAFDLAEQKAKQTNEFGLDTSKKFTYSRTVDVILEKVL